MSESARPAPTTPYGASKLAAESYVTLFHEIYGLETVSLRYFNVYGPRHRGGAINTFLRRILENQPPIIHGNGQQTRDFVNVQDIVDANMLALANGNAVGRALNIATGVPISVKEVADTLLQLLGRAGVKPIHTEPRPGDVKEAYADISTAKEVLGYTPKVSLKEGINNLLRERRTEKHPKTSGMT